MKGRIHLTLLACGSIPLQAATVTSHYDFTVNSVIPDNNPIGFSDTRQVVSPGPTIIGVTIQLFMAGGWAGDLYAYVTHGSGFAVLLNRPGRGLGQLAGSGASSLDIVLSDNALADIHTAISPSGLVAGVFQPDGRTIDPDNSLNTSPRSAFLSSFHGLDANGDWTLFVADVSGGDEMILSGWSLTLQTVPEPTMSILTLAGLTVLLRRRRN